jgi:gamma-glutamyltranspeptidase / glutathione hydrolase
VSSRRRLPVSVAAGSASTAEVGGEILARGGSAADAAVAMVLASCAAETVFTGLSGGGFATHYDASSGETRCLDFFVAVPGLAGQVSGPPQEVLIDFGGQVVPYAVGPGTVAVPGVPAGLAALHDRWGTLDWRDLVEPARRLADAGVPFGEQQAKVLTTVADAMLLGDGTAAYAPDGVLLDGTATLHHPGLSHAFEVLRDEGADGFYSGSVADAIIRTLGEASALSQVDLDAYQARETTPREVHLSGCLVQARGDDLDDLLGVLVALDLSGDDAEMAGRLVEALRANPRRGDTTSVAAADADGNLCAATTSLGLSSGVWLSEFGLHLNSMMGEGELLRGDLVPGQRMGSMMTPLVMHDDDGPSLVAGAAGGSRIRSALAQVLVRVVRESMPVAAAIAAPRLNPVPGKVHMEPGFPESVVDALAHRDAVVRWPSLDSYFGGVAAIDRTGPGADPRRGGDTRRLPAAVS